MSDYGGPMKTLFKKHKKQLLNLVLPLALVAAALLSSANTQAGGRSQTSPYYGEDFYKDLSGNVHDEDLVRRLRAVLTGSHMPSQDGGLDQIAPTCPGKSCYKHTALGYDRARIFMMGVYYLVKDGKGYALPDVYCGGLKHAEDFPSNPPAPQTIPNGSVINTEHTWPQSKFTGKFDRETQKSDLHHLYPTDSEMNSIRGNNKFGEVAKDDRPLKCPASRYGQPAEGGDEVFEPPKEHKGNVARALFYFSVRYEMPIGGVQEQTLRRWNQEDPVDDEEIRRNNEIQKVQGNRNPFVDYPELVEKISKFQ